MINLSSKKVFPLLLFIIFSFVLKAQTNVSGFISANTTWDLAGSPYIVVGNALVSTGYTLTIEPGVVVKFDSATVLQIDGQLIASGTPQSRITFTSNRPSPALGDWGEIHFSATCISAVFDSSGNYVSGCIMKNCDVLYGGGLKNGAIYIQSSSPYFTQCKIMNSSSDGIYCECSTYLIDSSAIRNCSGYGLEFECFANPVTYGLLLQGDTIENNLMGGLILFSNYSESPRNNAIIIRNNYFLSNKNYSAIYSFDFSNQAQYPLADSIMISGNLFEYNGSGPYDDGVGTVTLGAWNYIIECNRFTNNHPVQAGVVYLPIDGGGIIRNNIFQGNELTNGPSVITDYLYQWITPRADTYFTNNYIRGNSSQNSSCCQFFSGTIPNSTFHINNNEFAYNKGTSIIHMTVPNIGTSSDSLFEMKQNNFLVGNSQPELYDAIPTGSGDIYVDSNYWGGTSNQYLDSAIYDFFDNGNYSVAYYQPVLTAPVVIDTSCTSSFPTGIKNIDVAIHSNAFPNPFSTSTEVMFGKELRDGEVVIYNVFGQQVSVMENMNGNEVRIERGNLSSGVYIYEVLDKQGMVGNGKLVVE